MKFVCDKCSTRYSIAEERVRGKILKIRCKNCGNVITVRDGMEAEPVNRTGRATMAVPLISPAAIAPQPPSALQEEWYVSIDGVQTGPLSLADAQRWIAGKPFDAELHCWNEGFDDWLPVEKVSHFRNLRKAPVRTRTKTAPPPTPEKPLFAATMASLERGANGSGPAASAKPLPPVSKPVTPAQPRPMTPAQPRPMTPMTPAQPRPMTPMTPAQARPMTPMTPAQARPMTPMTPAQPRANAPALPKQSSPALPRPPATPALPRPAVPAPVSPLSAATSAAAAAASAAGKPSSPTPIRGSSASALSARPGGASTANKVISSVGGKASASAGAAALADAFSRDEAADTLGGAPPFHEEAPTRADPTAPSRARNMFDTADAAPAVDLRSMREALDNDDNDDDGLSIGEVSRVVKLADLAPKPKSTGSTASVQRVGTSGSGMQRAMASSSGLTGAQPRLSPGELGMNVDPSLAAAATRPGELGPDESTVAASIAQKHRRGLIILIASSALLVAALIGVVAWKVSQNPDEVGGGLGGTKQIDTSRPEDIIRRQQQQPTDTGSGSAKTTAGNTHRPHPINAGNGSQTQPDDNSLQAGEVEDMAAKQNEGTMRCYMRAQKGAMGLEIDDVKKVAVTLGVNKDGAVSDVQLSTHANDSFGQCLIARIKAWRFRASPNGGTFRISLAFGN